MSCISIQRSLDWCMGTPELPGIRNTIFYIAKSDILSWPATDKKSPSEYIGDFTIAPWAKWSYITILGEKSTHNCESQGDAPNTLSLNKLSVVHPSAGAQATFLASIFNNSDCVFIFQDMKGHFRVLGSKDFPTKTTVSQDLSTASTTISIEAFDHVPSPFYSGEIDTIAEDETQIFDHFSERRWSAVEYGSSNFDDPTCMTLLASLRESTPTYSKFRSDFRRTSFFSFLPAEAPLFAFRITDPLDLPEITSRNINLNVRFVDEKSGKSYLFDEAFKIYPPTKLSLSDGSSVFVFDVLNTPFSGSAKIPANTLLTEDIFTVKIADIFTTDTSKFTQTIKFYWFHTFTSLDHIKWFIKSHDGLSVV